MEEQSRGVCPGPAGLKVCGLDWWCVSRACWFESVWFGLAVSVEEQSRGVCPGPAGLKACSLVCPGPAGLKACSLVCVQGLLV